MDWIKIYSIMPTMPKYTTPQRARGYSEKTDRDANNSFYWSRRWRKAAKVIRSAQPFCTDPFEVHDVPVASEVVDHVVPLWRRPDLALPQTNLQALCTSCHNRKTAIETQSKGNK